MKKALSMILACVLCLALCACAQLNNSKDRSYSSTNAPSAPKNDYYLSDTCDYVLCTGTDNDGDFYELVANQKESSSGFEISVGVIKNNAWLYQMSKDFPFLGDDNLFHITGNNNGKEGTSLKVASSVIKEIYFVDTGAFLLDCCLPSTRGPFFFDNAYIIFNCDSLDSCTINREETSLVFLKNQADFGWNDSTPSSYGQIYTENGKLIMCRQLTQGVNNPVYDWCIFDMRTLKYDVIAPQVERIRAESVLREGLFLASDQCFYNTSAQKIIDLSSYDIVEFADKQSYFHDGTCTFIAKNSLGTRFRVTIDSSGNVLSEEKET